MDRLKRLDIQSKIILVLVAVIVPTFIVVTAVENKLAHPMLEGEMRHVGINAAESLATKIEGARWLQKTDGANFIQNEIQELLYSQTSIIRMEVYTKDPLGDIKLLASSVIDDDPRHGMSFVEKPTAEFRRDEEGVGLWDVKVPIRREGANVKSLGKVIGMVHVVVSTKTVNRLLATFSKITGLAALVSVVILILVLSFFLRKTVSNERRLRQAENKNLQLSEQLHETQRQLMNVEKFAVMGQLTATVAHEIGTPLNAIGGHLQLLFEELKPVTEATQPDGVKIPRAKSRMETIQGELHRIEKIVKNFLQTTSKPASQKQLVDINSLIDKTLRIVGPRLESLALDVHCDCDRTMGPLRVVPLDIEQILLNLVTNALDSLQSKKEYSSRKTGKLEIVSKIRRLRGGEWVEIAIRDTGMGISKDNLHNVTKPFFTTKRPGEGTGLGLTICQQLASKYGGSLQIRSKEGAWASATLRLPYLGNQDGGVLEPERVQATTMS